MTIEEEVINSLLKELTKPAFIQRNDYSDKYFATVTKTIEDVQDFWGNLEDKDTGIDRLIWDYTLDTIFSAFGMGIAEDGINWTSLI